MFPYEKLYLFFCHLRNFYTLYLLKIQCVVGFFTFLFFLFDKLIEPYAIYFVICFAEFLLKLRKEKHKTEGNLFNFRAMFKTLDNFDTKHFVY